MYPHGGLGVKNQINHTNRQTKDKIFFILDIFGALVDVPTWRPWGKSTY
jgi:hypothetical protein